MAAGKGENEAATQCRPEPVRSHEVDDVARGFTFHGFLFKLFRMQ